MRTPNTRVAPALAATIFAASASAQSYTVTNLGALDVESAAFALSPTGDVSGFRSNADHEFRAAVWSGGATMLVAPLPGDNHAVAMAIVGPDMAAGSSYALGGVSAHGFLLSGGVTSDLGDFVPRAMAPSGMMVGAVSALEGPELVRRPAQRSGGATVILPVFSGNGGQAFDVNVSGWIVGESMNSQRQVRAALWQNGAISDLGTLGGTRSWAHAINDSGLVVGASETAAADIHAALFTLGANGQVLSRTDLGTLADRDSRAFDVNSRAQIVGVSNARAVMWRAGEIITLDERIPPAGRWRLEVARALNDSGEIVGFGYELGTPSAFLLTPCAGDANVDFLINFADLNELLAAFNTVVAPGSGADFTNDGSVNFDDLNLILSNFNSVCP